MKEDIKCIFAFFLERVAFNEPKRHSGGEVCSKSGASNSDHLCAFYG